MATTRSARTSANPRTAPAKPAATATGERPPREKIAVRAYEIWQSSGRPEGHDQEHWLQAERELRSGASAVKR